MVKCKDNKRSVTQRKDFSMKIYEYEHTTKYFDSKILKRYIGDMSLGVFDIETLGLYPKQDPMILAGIMSVESDGSCHVRQLFAENSSASEEIALLTELQSELNRFDCLLSFNGKRFDLPYVRERALRLGLSDYRIDPFNIDLLLFLRHYSSLRDTLGNLKQKTVERYMGLSVDRDDEISGGDSIIMYREFERSSDMSLKKALCDKILLHNHDDLLQLYKIFPVILQTDIHAGMNKLGFPLKGVYGWPNLHIQNMKVNASGLTVSGVYTGSEEISFWAYSTPEMPYNSSFSTDGSFQIELPIKGLKAQLTDPLSINDLAKKLLLKFMRDNERKA